MLTSDDLISRKFTATKFREGYDIVEVDDFLDVVAAALRRHERGEPLGLSIADIETQRFTATKLREGYDIVDVDTLLDEITATLTLLGARTHESSHLVAVAAEGGPFAQLAERAARARFSPSGWGGGYEVGAVDAILARIVSTAVARDQRRSTTVAGEPLLTGVELQTTTLPRVRFRPGYATAEVDAFLRKAAGVLG
ncbi:DivIVA domain-containing protein [Flavimobilis sp. GY10621]|uniref:Cell wall synthesis protein Wag31 n=1 Tax=Flavimobilis rhizosphaerae TaxID=2775421 RepID=A0ABR9DQ58_9MICO|nr:DivIVA domain-containing protein [Flavimobilis rhizosphaerae]MBD9699260.1 DivIVA domain-containing protein [Flavimobilis rhizosphaerae]